jgi:hypothetical protein
MALRRAHKHLWLTTAQAPRSNFTRRHDNGVVGSFWTWKGRSARTARDAGLLQSLGHGQKIEHARPTEGGVLTSLSASNSNRLFSLKPWQPVAAKILALLVTLGLQLLPFAIRFDLESNEDLR